MIAWEGEYPDRITCKPASENNWIMVWSKVNGQPDCSICEKPMKDHVCWRGIPFDHYKKQGIICPVASKTKKMLSILRQFKVWLGERDRTWEDLLAYQQWTTPHIYKIAFANWRKKWFVCDFNKGKK